MRELRRIQKREKLNIVFATDEQGPGEASHEYKIVSTEGKDSIYEPTNFVEINFQNGPRKVDDLVHGVIDSDLLEVVRDRLIAFQAGPFVSEYNAQSLVHIEEALMCMNRRVEDRLERNVLGTYNK